MPLLLVYSERTQARPQINTCFLSFKIKLLKKEGSAARSAQLAKRLTCARIVPFTPATVANRPWDCMRFVSPDSGHSRVDPTRLGRVYKRG